MTTLPPELQYGHVVGRVILAVADTGDADTFPDAVPAQGTVTFTPKNPEIRVGEPDPVVVLKQKIVCTIDAAGYLTDPDGKRGVWLVTGVYTVSYSFTAASLPNHDIVVGEAHTQASPLDLTLALPPGGPVLTPSQYAELTARIDSLVFEAAGVSSVNGETGAVVLDADDVGALPSTYTPPAQSWADVTDKPATFAPTSHAASHAADGSDPITPADIGAATAAQGTKADSAVQPSDVDDVIREGDARLTDARTPTEHAHDAEDVTSGTFTPDRLGTGTPSASTVLYGDGAWKPAPSGGGGSDDALTPVSGSVALPTAPLGALRGYRATGATTFTAPDSTTASLPSGAYVFESVGSGAWTYRTLEPGAPMSPPPDGTPPAAGSLTASAVTDSGFTLTVSGASDGAGMHAEPYAFSLDNGATWSAWQAGTAYVATGLTASTAYQARHKVRDAAGNEALGSAISVTTTATPVVLPTGPVGATSLYGASQAGGGATAFTFPGVSLGTASQYRLIVAAVSFSAVNTRTISSCTIGGITATIVNSTGSGSKLAHFAYAVVPTGATGDVEVTMSAAVSDSIHLDLFEVSNTVKTHEAAAFVTGAKAVTVPTSTADGIALAHTYRPDTASHTMNAVFTGATEIADRSSIAVSDPLSARLAAAWTTVTGSTQTINAEVAGLTPNTIAVITFKKAT